LFKFIYLIKILNVNSSSRLEVRLHRTFDTFILIHFREYVILYNSWGFNYHFFLLLFCCIVKSSIASFSFSFFVDPPFLCSIKACKLIIKKSLLSLNVFTWMKIFVVIKKCYFTFGTCMFIHQLKGDSVSIRKTSLVSVLGGHLLIQ